MTQCADRRNVITCDSCDGQVACGGEYVVDDEVLCRPCACDCGSESEDANDHGINCLTTQMDLDR